MMEEADEVKQFQFYTEEELIKFSNDIKLAQKRTNLMMQVSRQTNALNIILYKMGFDTESALKKAESRGDHIEGGLYDAFLLVKYQRDAARLKLGQLPAVPKMVDMVHLFFYEVQKEDPVFWKEMKERAGARAAKINQSYMDSIKTTA